MFEQQPIRDAISFQEQSNAIQRIVPKGTPRDDAEKKLREAGIVGSFATKHRSVYHCELWNRPDGERWHLYVTLLFDDQKRLYAIRRAGGFDVADRTRPASPGEGASPRIPGSGPFHSQQLPVSDEPGTSRHRRRTPFASEN